MTVQVMAHHGQVGVGSVPVRWHEAEPVVPGKALAVALIIVGRPFHGDPRLVLRFLTFDKAVIVVRAAVVDTLACSSVT